MADGKLFEGLAEQATPARSAGRVRLRKPERDQIALRAVDLDSLLGEDHPARVIWAYVARLDLSALEDRIKAREGTPGHPPISPRLMLALWLYATSQGVGSARALAGLCGSHDAYRWLCGGVSVNYHTLSDFRVAHAALLDRLLAEHVAALASAGVIDLSVLAQDGMRVRAAAGAASFRRRATLERHLAAARELVEKLKQEVADDPAACNLRLRAARQRAARERAKRVEAALKAQAEAEAQRKRREKTNRAETQRQKEPRTSTTDPQARVLKMADGGFRPAYNLQLASVAERQIVVAVDASASGSDRGLLRPMLERVATRYGRLPERHLADGGFTKGGDLDWAHAAGVGVYCPPVKSKHGSDPYRPRPGDGPGVAAWRQRMQSQAGQAQYKRRAIAECVHARLRGWNLLRLTVRGLDKARTVLLWHALANNILQGARLRRAAAA